MEGLFQRELPAETTPLVSNVAHWGYGAAWGALFGVVAGSLPAPGLGHGLVLGSVAWTSGYLVLPLAKLYKPMWEYDGRALGRDLTAHMVYGLTTAGTFRAPLRR